MPRSRSPSKPRSKSVSSAARKRPASKSRKPARKSTPSRKQSPAKRRGRPSKSPGRKPSKSPGRKTGKSPAPAKKTPSTTPAKKTPPAVMTAKSSLPKSLASRSSSRSRKPTTTPTQQRGRSRSRSKTRAAKTDSKTTTIATKVEKKPSYTPPASSGLRPRRGIFSSGSESSRRLSVAEALRSRSTSGTRGRKGNGIVQNIVALPKRAWNAVRVPNAARRLKRHVKNNWKKYLLFFLAFIAVSVAYHFSVELSRSVHQLKTQVADFLEEQKKVFGDAIKRASRKVEQWTESSNKSQPKPTTTTHEHHHHSHVHHHDPSSPPTRQQPVTPQPGGALPLDDAI